MNIYWCSEILFSWGELSIGLKINSFRQELGHSKLTVLTPLFMIVFCVIIFSQFIKGKEGNLLSQHDRIVGIGRERSSSPTPRLLRVPSWNGLCCTEVKLITIPANRVKRTEGFWWSKEEGIQERGNKTVGEIIWLHRVVGASLAF